MPKSASEKQRDQRQREFLQRQDRIITGLRTQISELQKILSEAVVAREIAASGQSHAAALFVEWQTLWCGAMEMQQYDGHAKVDMAVLRERITWETKQGRGAEVVREKMRAFFASPNPWFRRQNYSGPTFKKSYHDLGAAKATGTTDRAVAAMEAEGWYDSER